MLRIIIKIVRDTLRCHITARYLLSTLFSLHRYIMTDGRAAIFLDIVSGPTLAALEILFYILWLLYYLHRFSHSLIHFIALKFVVRAATI